MLTEISFNGYKVFNGSQLSLKNLAEVNYLVGENGSGKSSVLELIAMISNSSYYGATYDLSAVFGTTNKVFDKDFSCSYIYQKHDTPHKGEVCLEPAAFDRGAIVFIEKVTSPLKLRDIGHYVNPSFKNLPTTKEIGILKDNIPQLISIDSLKAFVNTHKFFPIEVRDISRSAYEDSSIQFTLADGTKKNLKSLSSGQIYLVSFYIYFLDLYQGVVNYKAGNQSEDYMQIVCIDEPEIHLHPKFQKLIPTMLDEFTKTGSLMFFVATHSPFIVAKSSDVKNRQQVYMLERGVLKEPSKNQKSTVLLAAKMLGANETDFGYVENYCLVEENSMVVLLKPLAESGLIRNWCFISCGGDKKITGFAEAIEHFHIHTLVKCNPFYQDKFCIIVDNQANCGQRNIKKIHDLKDRMDTPDIKRVIELTKPSLEDYYDEDIQVEYNQAIREIKPEDHQEVGTVKADFARKVAKRIIDSTSPVHAFTNLFAGELDFLLNNPGQ